MGGGRERGRERGGRGEGEREGGIKEGQRVRKMFVHE